jgi:hypothetical protein
MANSVQQDWNGPDWPLGFIDVATPGTPVGIMSLVDPSSVNSPSSPTPGTADANEYTQRAQQIIFQAMKPGTTHGTQNNTGNVYIVRVAQGSGTGNRDDYGSIVKTLVPGETFILASAALNRNVFSPYRYRIDADNAGDGAFVTLLMQ